MPYHSAFKRYDPGDRQISASDMNRRADMLMQLANLLPNTGGAHMLYTGAGVFISRRSEAPPIDRFANVIRCKIISRTGTAPDWPENILYTVETDDGLTIPGTGGEVLVGPLAPTYGRFVRDGDAMVYPAEIGHRCALVMEVEPPDTIVPRLWVWSEKLNIGPCEPPAALQAEASESGEPRRSPILSLAAGMWRTMAERLRRLETHAVTAKRATTQLTFTYRDLDGSRVGAVTEAYPVPGMNRAGFAARETSKAAWDSAVLTMEGSVDGQAWTTITDGESPPNDETLSADGQIVGGLVGQYNFLRVRVSTKAASASPVFEVNITASAEY